MLAGYFLVNNLIMPAYTRHEVNVQVPDVRNQTFEEASDVLADHGLQAEKMVDRFNPSLPRGVIVDQIPPANDAVKPGRRIYLTVNSGEVPMVTVPSVKDFSLREAVNRLQAVGLEVQETRPDSIPSPHQNTVTRQRPAAGESIPQGSQVTLWYSTGLGDAYVTIPDVTGMTVEEARAVLLNRRLRAVAVGLENFDGLGEPIVQRQSREPGTRVREGFELRLFLTEE